MSKQRFSYTKEFFRRIAITGWNKSPYFTYSSKYSVLRRWLIAKFSARQKMVLSIGCGSGELESELNQRGRKVVGLAQRRTRAGALFQCAALLRWDAAEMARLVGLDSRVAAELADIAGPLPVDDAALEAAFLDALPG